MCSQSLACFLTQQWWALCIPRRLCSGTFALLRWSRLLPQREDGSAVPVRNSTKLMCIVLLHTTPTFWERWCLHMHDLSLFIHSVRRGLSYILSGFKKVLTNIVCLQTSVENLDENALVLEQFFAKFSLWILGKLGVRQWYTLDGTPGYHTHHFLACLLWEETWEPRARPHGWALTLFLTQCLTCFQMLYNEKSYRFAKDILKFVRNNKLQFISIFIQWTFDYNLNLWPSLFIFCKVAYLPSTS